MRKFLNRSVPCLLVLLCLFCLLKTRLETGNQVISHPLAASAPAGPAPLAAGSASAPGAGSQPGAKATHPQFAGRRAPGKPLRYEKDLRERDGDEEFGEREGEAEEEGMMEAMEQEFRRTRSPLTGDVPRQHLLEAVQQRDAQWAAARTAAAISGITWSERGPSNVGGRTRALHFDLNDASYKKVWAGSVAGGIWYTSDITAGTITWNKVNDFLDNLAVTTIAQSPANKQIFYAGTGEGWFNTDAIRGGGVFKSTDGGSTWSALSSTAVTNTGSSFSYVQKIVVTSGGIVLAGTKYGGLQRSTDNGSTWTRVLSSSSPAIGGNGACTDIEIAADGTIYAAMGIFYNGGIYRSTDNGANWTQVYTSASDEQRIELACAPSASATVYALVQKSDQTVKKLMYTTNATAGTPTWTSAGTPTWCDQGSSSNDFTRGQAWYDLAAAVDPNDANIVFAGGVDVMKYSVTTGTWSQVTQWASGCSNKPYVHADIHALTFKPSSSSEMLVGCDGGIYRTADGGSSFTSRNNGFNVTQFYSVATHPTNENYFLAGAQDNGTQKFTASGVNSTTQASGGDGGFCHIDKTNSNIQISSYVYNNYYISTNGGTSFSYSGKNNNGQFINPWDYDDTNDILYAASSDGTYFRWNSPATGGSSGEVTVSSFAGAGVTAVAMSPTVANRVYFGLDNGDVVMVDNANGTPTGTVIRSGTGSVSCIAINSADENKMIVTYFNYDVTSVYYSSNGASAAATWTSIEGNLPNMPVRWALFDPRASTKALLATELGVWSTDAINGGSTNWGATVGGLANVRVDMLQYNSATMTLAAATHGRGLYTTVLCGTTAITTQPTAQAVCSGSSVTFSVAATGAGLSYQWRKGGSNISGATSSSYTIASATAANAASYDVVVSGTCGNVTSNSVALTINTTSITTQPTAQSVCTGATATFTVVASGSSLSYQWRKGGTNISGATSASLSLSNVSATDAASYDVVVTGTCGSVTSNSVALTVNSTSITTQPVAQSVCSGGTATFTVVASGTSLSYQWKKNGSNISGATSATLTLNNVSASDATTYTVTVTGSCGSVTSSAVALTVGATSITTQPVAQAVCTGSSASFTVAASGTGLSYQWRKDGSNISGATSATYTVASVAAADAASYDVVVTSSCGSATSNAVALTIIAATSVTTQPSAQTVCSGSAATFSVAATGASLTYQWKKAGSNISGATSATYTIASAVAGDAASYSVTVTGTCGSVSSNTVALTVNTATSITTQPVAATVCSGSPALFTVAASGTSLAYQWRKGGSNISGATSATYSIASATAADAASYDVVVTGSCGTATSGAVALTVNAATSITTHPSSQSVCPGGAPVFNVSATGATLVYQWKKDGSNIAGATAAVYFINSVGTGDAGSYTVTVSGTCGSVTSNAAVLTVNSGASINTQPASVTACTGASASFGVGATGSGLAYQWKKNGSNISGATSATLNLSNVGASDAASYTVTVSGTCGSVTSSAATLALTTTTSITTQPSAATVCNGSPASFSVVAAGAALSYQWKKDGNNISGANAATYSIPAADAGDGGSYTVVVTGTCGTATSAAATLTVNSATAITAQPAASQTLCAGSSASFTVAATGTGLSYQWKKDGASIAGATAATYAIPVLAPANAGTYTVDVSGSCGTVTSTNSVLAVNAATAITGQPAAQSICAGAPVSLSVAATGTALTYQWKKDGGNISGATASSYGIAVAGPGDAGSYSVQVNGTCGTVTSSNAVVTVNAITSITSAPAAQAVCAGSAATFTVAATGSGTLTYQWKKDGVNINGATGTSYTIPSAAAGDAGSYTVTVSGSCGTQTSAGAVLTINAATAITSAPAGQTVCAGSNVTFAVGATGSGTLSYQWKKDGTDISGATSPAYTIINAGTNAAGVYTVAVTGGCGTAVSPNAALVVNAITAITTQPAGQTVCPGSAVTLGVGATGTSLSYQWKKDGSNIAGATSATYAIGAAAASDAASYTVLVSGACGTLTSNAAVLALNNTTTIATHPAAQVVCAGASASFTVVASGTSLTYQWRKGGSNISGAAAPTLTLNNVSSTDAGVYDVVVTGTCGATTSSSAALAVNNATTITTAPAAQSACVGGNAVFTVTATGSGTLTYQWTKDGVNINSATGTSLSLTNLAASDAAAYSVTVTGACGTVTTTPVNLSVVSATTITTQPVSQTVCAGSAASFTVAASGSGLQYQWKKDGTDIGGANSATYTIGSAGAASAGSYTVVVTGSCGTTTSASATLTVNAATSIGTQPLSATVCAGSAATFSVVAAGNGLNYQWQKDGANIAGATSATYSIAATTAADAGSYTLVVTGTCGTVTSAAATLTVNAATVIATQPVAQAACSGNTVTFTVGATGSGVSYQWKKDGASIAGATAATYSIPAATSGDAGTYAVIVTGTCGTATSANAVLTVTTSTIITTQPLSQSVCTGGDVTFNVIAAGAGLGYQWKKDGVNISSATASSYTINGVGASTAGVYTVVVTGTCGTLTSNGATLTVNAAPVILAQPVALTTCVNTAANFSVTATGSSPLSYQWKKDGANISGAGSASYSFGPVTAADAGSYSVVVSNTCGSVASGSVALAVDPCTAVSSLDPDVSGSLLIPNPVRDIATLRLTVRRTVSTQWVIYDSRGRAVQELRLNAFSGRNEFRLSLGHLAGGTYYLVGRTDHGSIGLIRFTRQ